MKTDIPIDTLLKRLHLANARRVWRDLCGRAEKEEWAYDQFLGVLVAEEVAHRQQTRLQKVSRSAGFPFLKTVDDFDFTYQSTVRMPVIGSFLSADFVTEGRSLILQGRPGRGKTHLAIAIAYRAIQNGFDAHFVTAAALIEELSVASRQGKLREAVADYTHPHVLVVDEIGYLAYGDDAANVLYHVVNQRHLKKRSMIFTTNKPLDAWGQVLHDKDLGDAIVDRILERGRLLKLDGPSIRTKHLGLDDPTAEASTQPARISGIPRKEFPEPTAGTQAGREVGPSPRAPYDASMRRAEVLQIIATHEAELRSLGVRTLSVFGSVARDQAGPGSDVDFLVEFQTPVSFFELFDLQERLEALLGCKVDLVTRGGLRPELRDGILAEAVRAA